MVNGVSGYGNSVVNLIGSPKGTKEAEKPVWDGRKSYTYLEDSNQAGLEYGAKAVKYYASKTAMDGEMTVEELKKQIGEWFSDYTLTNHEPKNVVQGKHYLYIDDSQLSKMAKDASYRAKVYGLMDRETTVGKEYTLRYSDGRDVTSHITGSIFSLSEKNKKYAGADGVPYLGSCMSDHPWSSSNSHPQVRNMSFLSDNLDPAKSARKSRTSATSAQAEQLMKKRAEKKKEMKRAEKRKAEKTRLETLQKKVPSLRLKEGAELSLARDNRCGDVALHPDFLQKAESDPEAKKRLDDLLKGIAQAEKLAAAYYNGLGGVTERTSHWFINENGELSSFGYTKRVDGQNQLIRERQQKMEEERIERQRESNRTRAEERLQKLLEKKESSSKDGAYTLDSEDLKPILHALREDIQQDSGFAARKIDIRA